jgi:Glucoamylase and related glycosyl hydrolases
VTAQERWEENSGYSPSTLAVVIAALACAADWAMETGTLTRRISFSHTPTG